LVDYNDDKRYVFFKELSATNRSSIQEIHPYSGVACVLGKFDLHIKFPGPLKDSAYALGGKGMLQGVLLGSDDPESFEKSPEALGAVYIYPGTGSIGFI
jgi:hypothetical protein